MATRCPDCDARPLTRCARCDASLCDAHRPAREARCAACEREWTDELPTRRALQRLFAPSATVMSGGLTFLFLMPVLMALPFSLGAPLVAALATAVGLSGGVATYRLVNRAARAQFLREHARALPVARVVRVRRALPSPR
jgi:hypothetical protein